MRSTFETWGGQAGPTWTDVGEVRRSELSDVGFVERLCAGHFPGDPIVPGAVLAGWLADGSDRTLHQATFQAPVRPGDRLVATLQITARGQRGRVEHRDGRAAVVARLGPPRPPQAVSGQGLVARPIAASRIGASLRHAPPALLIARGLGVTDDHEVFEGRPGSWHWTQGLDASAQASGLAFRQTHAANARLGQPLHVAAYEAIAMTRPVVEGSPRLWVRHKRVIMGMKQYDVDVVLEGQTWLSARVTLAPVGEQT